MAIFVPLFDNDSISGQDVFRYIKRNIQVLSDHPDHRRELAPIFRRGTAYRQFFIFLFVHVPGKIHKPVSARSTLSAGRRAGSRCCRAPLADGCLITPDGPRLSGVAAVECLRHGGGGPGIKNKNQNPGESRRAQTRVRRYGRGKWGKRSKRSRRGRRTARGGGTGGTGGTGAAGEREVRGSERAAPAQRENAARFPAAGISPCFALPANRPDFSSRGTAPSGMRRASSPKAAQTRAVRRGTGQQDCPEQREQQEGQE